MDTESEWLESERLRFREWIANMMTDTGELTAFGAADHFILELWREGFAVVPRALVDAVYLGENGWLIKPATIDSPNRE